MKTSQLEQAYFDCWQEKGLPDSDITKQYKFCPERNWRLDFAFPSQRLGIEIQGLGRGRYGGHQTAQGMRNDCEKHNTAVLMGWRILLFTGADNNPEDWVYQTCLALCYPNGN